MTDVNALEKKTNREGYTYYPWPLLWLQNQSPSSPSSSYQASTWSQMPPACPKGQICLTAGQAAGSYQLRSPHELFWAQRNSRGRSTSWKRTQSLYKVATTTSATAAAATLDCTSTQLWRLFSAPKSPLPWQDYRCVLPDGREER